MKTKKLAKQRALSAKKARLKRVRKQIAAMAAHDATRVCACGDHTTHSSGVCDVCRATPTAAQRCPVYRPDHNGECLACDEGADAHSPEAIRRGQSTFPP